MTRLPVLVASVILAAGCVGPSSPSPRPTQSPVSPPGPTATPSATSTAPVPAIELTRSDVARIAADPAAAVAAAEAINAFGLNLYARVAATPGNLVLSPASIAIALSMTRAGARGVTAEEMDAVLHDLGTDELAEAANALEAALASRTGTFQDASGKDQPVTLRITNGIFSQRGMALKAAFLEAMATRFGAGVWTLDYRSDPETARMAINAWVAEQTAGRIEEILKNGDITIETRLALANAIYLKAAWLTPFDEEATATGAFTLADGTSVQVPLMHTATTLAFGAGDGWRAVELPYVGSGLVMTVIVPDDLGAFESSFDAVLLAGIVDSLDQTAVDLTMPTFDTESRFPLEDDLPALGMPVAFDPLAADFSGMTTEANLFIQKVLHQANITVDEAGTEAAAATVVLLGDTSAGPEPVDVRVDRPFLFVLRDVPTGAILFLGRVADPSATR